MGSLSIEPHFDFAQALRPFDRATVTLVERPPPIEVEDQDTAATIRAGGPSQFTVTSEGGAGGGGSIIVNWPPDKPPAGAAPTLLIEEVERETDTVRVTDESGGSEAYVDVARILNWWGKLPPELIAALALLGIGDGQTPLFVQLKMNPPAGTPPP